MSIKTNSQEFIDAFSARIRGPVLECKCGRNNYDFRNDYDWDEGELEELIADENAVGHDGSFPVLSIAGEWVIPDCPCNKALDVEAWLIAHQAETADFLNARAKDLIEEAESIKVG